MVATSPYIDDDLDNFSKLKKKKKKKKARFDMDGLMETLPVSNTYFGLYTVSNM